MSTPERKIEDLLVHGVENQGGECLKLEVKGRTGWMDRLCLLPFGVTVLVEVKQPKGRLSEKQRAKLRWAKINRHYHAVVWDEDGVYDLLSVMARLVAHNSSSLAFTSNTTNLGGDF